jgi:hypothetical protein
MTQTKPIQCDCDHTLKAFGAKCPMCVNAEQTKPTPEEEWDMLKAFGNFRRELRDIMYEHGILSNPGSTDQEVLDGIRQAIKLHGDRIRKETIAECARVADEYVFLDVSSLYLRK